VFVLIGFVVVFGSIVVGYTMHGGKIGVLIQISEFIIIGGAGIGAVLIGNKPSVMKGIVTQTFSLLKPSPYTKDTFKELLQVLYAIFYAARKDGLVGIEPHVEEPESSEIFKQFPSFHGNHHAVAFLADTMKVLLTGAVEDHHLSEILEMDLEQHHHEAMEVPHALQTVGDAMPGFGIVAAVLGVIITMGKIGGSPEAVGKSVAAALWGPSWGFCWPTASSGRWPRPSPAGWPPRSATWGSSGRPSSPSPGVIRPSPRWSSPAGTSTRNSARPSPSSRR